MRHIAYGNDRFWGHTLFKLHKTWIREQQHKLLIYVRSFMPDIRTMAALAWLIQHLNRIQTRSSTFYSSDDGTKLPNERHQKRITEHTFLLAICKLFWLSSNYCDSFTFWNLIWRNAIWFDFVSQIFRRDFRYISLEFRYSSILSFITINACCTSQF